jgi:proteasome lid subunit RPN8/RPN11
MLTISKAVFDGIVEHVRAEHPVIACGIVAGGIDSDRPERLIPLRNAERSETFWRLDPVQQLRVYREMDERGEEPVVLYRSYTNAIAYPSQTDVTYADPSVLHQVFVSTLDPHDIEFRSFQFDDGEITEEEVRVVPLSRRRQRAPHRRPGS